MEKKLESTQYQFYIEMFGSFRMSGQGCSLKEEQVRSDMLVKLISYIYGHKKNEIAVQELMDALWDEDESVNPAGALKNLVYRLRTLLRSVWPEYDFILTGRGSYKWNEEISVISDTEILERNCQLAAQEQDDEIKTEYYLEAVGQYKGPFLPKIGGEHWVTPWAAHFHSMYISAVKTTAELLDEQKKYELMEKICNKALEMDPLSEELHCCFIKALLYQNKIKLAEQHYKKAIDLLYEQLGISPSDELRDLYQEFLKEVRSKEMDIAFIQAELRRDVHSGAFMCEYGLFKKTYHLEKFRAERFGMSVYLALITVEPLWDVKPDTQAYLNIINEAMGHLSSVLRDYLRSGDVITRYSAGQYIVLLPSCQYETAKMVSERVSREFLKRYKKKPRAKLICTLDEMNFSSNKND